MHRGDRVYRGPHRRDQPQQRQYAASTREARVKARAPDRSRQQDHSDGAELPHVRRHALLLERFLRSYLRVQGSAQRIRPLQRGWQVCRGEAAGSL